MEKKTFKTLIKGDHKHSNNDYIKGRISGIQFVMCGGEETYPHIRNNDGAHILTHACTEKEYKAFADRIEWLYPGLCIFDWKE